MSTKFRLKGPLDKQHGKQAETLIQSQRQHLYHFIDHWEGNWVGKSNS